jgi:phosphate transport system substrate-binding protein
VNGVLPSAATVNSGKYQPLARPLFIYVRKSSANKPHVAKFVRFYIQNSAKMARRVGYVGLPSSINRLALQRFNKKTAGSLFAGKGAVVGVRLSDLLRRSR